MSATSSDGCNGPEAVIVHLRALWRGARLVEHLLTGSLLTLALTLWRPHAGRRTPAAVVGWWHRRLCRILGVRPQVQGPVPAARGLLVANHVSWLDIPVLGGLVPVDFVSKMEVRGWPLVGWLAAAAGTLFIDRGRGDTGRLDRQMRLSFQQRRAVLLFPEGTTTDGSGVRAFFPRLFRVALEAGEPVTPVALRYVAGGEPSRAAPFIGDDSFPGHLRRMLREPATDVLIRFRDPVRAADPTRRSLACGAREQIQDALHEMSRSAPGARACPQPAGCGQ
jgi:1-acyl-sn-glycerol-3-phosphate acyltransferase